MARRCVVAGACVLAVLACVAGAGLPEACVAAPAKACLPKCCGEGEAMRDLRAGKCVPSDEPLLVTMGNATEPASPEEYVLVPGDPCLHGKYVLERELPEDAHWLLANGSLAAPGVQAAPLPPSDFCVERDLEDSGVRTFVCFTTLRAEQGIGAPLYPVGLLLSVPFLLATLYVYSRFPELRSVYSRALCCFLLCEAVAYAFLAVAQLAGRGLSRPGCVAFAYIIQFSFVAGFFWLSVLCVDSFWTILTVTGCIGYHPDVQWKLNGYGDAVPLRKGKCGRENDRHFASRLLIGYSFYGWGVPILLLLIVIISDFTPTVPVSYLKVGELICLISNEQAALRYFYVTIGILLAKNIVLLSITIFKLLRHNSVWHERKSHPQRAPKQRARMCIVLFVVVSINWVLEIVSWAKGYPPIVWAVVDSFAALQGIVIFCIFVMEPTVKDIFCARLCRRNNVQHI